MVERIASRVKETTATTGTGTIDLDGAVSGFQTFVDGHGAGEVYYMIHDGGSNWEVGLGTVTDAATDTLSRDLVLASSNAGAAVSFASGTKNVELTLPVGIRMSDRVELRAELADGTNGGAYSTGNGWNAATVNTETSDPSAIASISSNQFTLERGTYEIKAIFPVYDAQNCAVRLRNITDSATTLQGTNGRALDDTGEEGQTSMILLGRFSITTTKTFELQVHPDLSTGTQGRGVPATFGSSEIFGVIELHRVNPFGEELVYAERVKETSTTTGTGALDLAGSLAAFQTFVAGIGDTNKTAYAIVSGTEWEVGFGTVTDAATDTLSRDLVLASSNAGALVNFSAGTKTVFCCRLPGCETHDYVMVQDKKSSGTTSTSYASGAWRTHDINTETSDPSGLASVASNQVTLQEGIYEAYAVVSGFGSNMGQARIQNVSDGETLLLGPNSFNRDDAGEQQDHLLIVRGEFEITALKVVEVQVRGEDIITGSICDTGEDEVYLTCEFRRVGRIA